MTAKEALTITKTPKHLAAELLAGLFAQIRSAAGRGETKLVLTDAMHGNVQVGDLVLQALVNMGYMIRWTEHVSVEIDWSHAK